MNFRENHLFKILHSFEIQRVPLDLFLRHYFRSERAIGSKDRRFLSETIYGMIRWKGLLSHLCQSNSWEDLYRCFASFNATEHHNNLSIPPHIRASFPEELYHLLEKQYGEEEGFQLCLSCNDAAPTTIRVNPLKTNRENLLKLWESTFPITPCLHSSLGINFGQRVNFSALPEFHEGLFEVQDEGSQLIAELIDPMPGQEILDFCAGAGGKSLAFAHKTQGRGQIYLHDPRQLALQEAKKRFKRAGIQNAQFLQPMDKSLRALKGRMDWVLVDVPCSGSGTLRRNPDMKWKFSNEQVDRLVQEQREIFSQAFTFLHPRGKIVYATCSMLSQENEEQVDYFKEKFKLELDAAPFSSLPQKGGMDGFYGAVLKKQTLL